jgi:hypothetical protein
MLVRRTTLRGLNIEQFRCGAAKDVRSLVVGERFSGKDRVHRVKFPGIGIVAAEHDLTGADLGHQMADGLRVCPERSCGIA